jgi:hypothetical protein
MLPEHLCRKDIPGLDEAISAKDYARLEGLSMDEVLAGIHAREVLGVFFDETWYVEAPAFCEERLSGLSSTPLQKLDGANEARETRIPDQIAVRVSDRKTREQLRRLRDNWSRLTLVGRIAAVTSLALFLVVIFPPFYFRSARYTVNMGFGFLFSPPVWQELRTEVNTPLLAIEVVVVLLVGGAACLCVRRSK